MEINRKGSSRSTRMRVLILLIWASSVVSSPPTALRGGAFPSAQRNGAEDTEQSPLMLRSGDQARFLSVPARKEDGDPDSVEDRNGGSFKHLGCFLDIRDDRMLGSRMSSPEVTPMMCHEHCDGMKAAYMGLQFGNECWCSEHGALDYERHGTGVCNMACAGDEDQTCGGDYSFDMYKLDWPDPSDDEEYVGCYADVKDERIMGDPITHDNMTPEMCRRHCENSYSIYYGTQYGNECWCGTSSWLSDYDRYGPGVCHMECSGKSEVACGGYEAFSLFRFLSDPVEDDDNPDNDDYTPSPVAKLEDDVYSTRPSSSETTVDQATVARTPGEDSGNYNVFADLLDLHNEIRCVHGADPLSWSEEIADRAEKFAMFLTDSSNCGEVFRSENKEYGENLFLCGLTSGYGCYNAELAMEEFYDKEITDSVTTYGPHATQIVWDETTEVGCGLSRCGGDYFYEVLVCNYNPRGDKSSERAVNVSPPVRSRGSCGLP